MCGTQVLLGISPHTLSLSVSLSTWHLSILIMTVLAWADHSRVVSEYMIVFKETESRKFPNSSSLCFELAQPHFHHILFVKSITHFQVGEELSSASPKNHYKVKLQKSMPHGRYQCDYLCIENSLIICIWLESGRLINTDKFVLC